MALRPYGTRFGVPFPFYQHCVPPGRVVKAMPNAAITRDCQDWIAEIGLRRLDCGDWIAEIGLRRIDCRELDCRQQCLDVISAVPITR